MPSSLSPSRRAFRPVFEAPWGLRAFIRSREWGVVFLGAASAAVAGLIVSGMSFAVNLLHAVFFALPLGERLSAAERLDPRLAVIVPTLGGLVFGITLVALARWRPAREVDPIEANALHGGQMSLTGSAIVALQTVWSTGVGAAVGLEAGYTQFASGVASWIGRVFHLRRRDLRVLVGCGAAAAIAGAFGAPLA
jgi:chloride channel protein, CIC family